MRGDILITKPYLYISVLMLTMMIAGCIPPELLHHDYKQIKSLIQTIDYDGRPKSTRTTEMLFSLDGRNLATATASNEISMWDVASGELQFRVDPHKQYIKNMEVSPCGRYILSFSNARKDIEIWSTETGKVVRNLGVNPEIHRFWRFSPDGKYLATNKLYSKIFIWTLNSEQVIELESVSPAGDENWCPSWYTGMFAPGDKYIQDIRGAERYVVMWSIKTGKILTRIKTNNKILAVSNDGSLLCTTDYREQELILWSLESGEQLYSFPLKGVNYPGAVELSRSNKLLFIMSTYPKIGFNVWDLTKKETVYFVESGSKFQLLDDNHIVFCNKTEDKLKMRLLVKRISDGQTVSEGNLHETPRFIQYNPDTGDISVKYFSYPKSIIDTTFLNWDGEKLVNISDKLISESFKLGPIKNTVVVASDKLSDVRANPHMDFYDYYLIDITNEKVIHSFKSEIGGIHDLKFSPDGESLISVGNDNTCRYLNAKTGKLERTVKLGEKEIHYAYLSQDCHTLVSCIKQGSPYFPGDLFEVWSLPSGKKLREFKLDILVSRTVLFPDGKRMVAASNNSRLRRTQQKSKLADLHIISIETGEIISTIHTKADSILSISVSHDESFIAFSGDNRRGNDATWILHLPDETITKITWLDGGLCLNHDDSILAHSQFLRDVCFHKTDSKSPIYTISSEDAEIDKMMRASNVFIKHAWSPVENIFASISGYGRIRIYRINIGPEQD